MRRRRRTKYYWLPVYGTPNSGDATIFSTTQQLQITVADADITTGWTPIVVNDVPNDISEENFPLNDIIGNEYIIKRVVGKIPCHVTYTKTSGADQILALLPPVVVSAGLYVARCDRDVNNFDPVDSAAASRLYNPLNSSLTREPWMWRRTWVLGPGERAIAHYLNAGFQELNSVLTVGGVVGANPFPLSNDQYGSVADGPHIDAKTARRVRQDEALFLGIAAHYYPFAVANPTLSTTVTFLPDLRVLGALRRAKNRSAF